MPSEMRRAQHFKYCKEVLMRKSYSLFFVICVSVLLFSCQATPTKPPVIYQGNDYIDGQTSEQSSELDVADHLSYSKDINGLLIQVDADVIVPKNKSNSVVEIGKAAFTKEDLQTYINYFTHENAVLYQNNKLTKRQIAELIVGLEEATPDQLPEDLAESVKNELKTLYETAPDEVSENNLRFSLDNVGSGETFAAYALVNDDTYCHIGGTMDGNTFSYLKNSYTIPTPQSIFTENDLEWKDYSGEFPISKQVLADLGIENMEVSDVEKACAYHYYKVQTVESKGWRVVFTRTSNGLPSIYVPVASLWNTAEAPALGAPWDQEVIFVTVDEAGVYCFDWRGAGKQKQVLQENIDLLPFEDILERVEKQLMYQHLPQNNEKVDFSISVKEIRLDSALVNVANEMDIGRKIPVWDIYYDIVYQDGSSSELETYVLTINAIDGRYIEPRITKTTIDEVSSRE